MTPPKRLCIIGATGLLGHYTVRSAAALGHEVVATGRDAARVAAAVPMGVTMAQCDVTSERDVAQLIADSPLDAVINCAGLTKKLCDDEPLAEMVNMQAPHVLARFCGEAGVRLIHVSTDCVFRGDRGMPYPEAAEPDAADVYGRTKAAGEVTQMPHLTVRTSFIGRELGTRFGLLEWFLAESGTVHGFTKHLWNGLTAPALSRILIELALERSDVTGILHVAGEATDKHALLLLLREAFGREYLEVIPQETAALDRRLEPTRLVQLGISVPPLVDMIEELASIG